MSEANNTATNYGPGNVLRTKRQEYEWSVEAVADALHLPVTHITAIEADRYDELPGSTYIIGYWRSYARLLGIDMEDTIEANKRNVIEEQYEDVVMASQEGMQAHGARSNSVGMLITVFLLLLLVAGGLWVAWKQQMIDFSAVFGGGSEESTQLEAEQPTTIAREVVEPVLVSKTSNETSSETASDTVTQPVVSTNRPTETGLSEAPLAKPTDPNQAAISPQPDAAANETDSGNATVDTTEVSDSQSEDKAASDTQTEQGAAPADPNEITLILEQDSWLDVRDRTLKRLIYRSETRNKTINLKGEPPFYVYIGTPSGVKVQYLGKEVPFEVHKSGLFARFKVGEKRS